MYILKKVIPCKITSTSYNVHYENSMPKINLRIRRSLILNVKNIKASNSSQVIFWVIAKKSLSSISTSTWVLTRPGEMAAANIK